MTSPSSPSPWWHHHHHHHHDDITTIAITIMKVTMIISMFTYSYPAFGYWVRNESVSKGLASQKLTKYGNLMSSTGWPCDSSLLPHFPSASQSCRSLSNCSCPITFAGSLSTDGISGTSQSTQQCRAILTKTHTHIQKHTHKNTHTC